jgi:cyclopropane-fatty-acyl-phospholipid synthase
MKDQRLPAIAVPGVPSDLSARGSFWLDRWALTQIARFVAPAPLRFVLWDGYDLAPPEPPVATILIKNRTALFKWLRDPELNFGEGFMSGAVEVQGDLVRMLEAVYQAMASRGPTARRWHWPRNTVHAARQNVHHHYDLGNDFYRLWLDREMVYTCAYFPTPDRTLEEAQIAKMERVCRKLRLQPGDRVIEAGCGWGSLALYMAREHGARVRAYNLSTEQIAYARERAKAEGLADRVEFVEDDYRNVTGQCDVFVSVGMLEHVGLPDYPTLGAVLSRVVTDAGRGLLHFIGRDRPASLNPWIAKRIFPGAYPPTLREVFEHVLEPAGFSVLDVENLRLHYAKTLEHWRTRYELAADRVQAMFDETFVRAWRLYLAGSEVSFTTGSLQLFQVLFAPGDSNAIPWTRSEG